MSYIHATKTRQSRSKFHILLLRFDYTVDDFNPVCWRKAVHEFCSTGEQKKRPKTTADRRLFRWQWSARVDKPVTEHSPRVRRHECARPCGCFEDNITHLIDGKLGIYVLWLFFINFLDQVAVMSGHFELGEIIKNHRDTDVGK